MFTGPPFDPRPRFFSFFPGDHTRTQHTHPCVPGNTPYGETSDNMSERELTVGSFTTARRAAVSFSLAFHVHFRCGLLGWVLVVGVFA